MTRWERAHARRWLDRHGAAGKEASPLLAARLAVRYRATWIEGAVASTGVVLLFGFLAWSLVRQMAWNLETARREAAGGGPDPGPEPGMFPPEADILMIVFTVAYGVMYLGILAALWYRRRADRGIGRTLPHRVARSSAVDLRRLLGGRFVVAAAVVYGGGLLVGAFGLVTGTGSDRPVAAVFLVSVLVFGGLGTAVLVDVARRPAVAVDEPSLADDDVLRREDGHRALTPYLVLFAFVAGTNSGSGDGLLAAYLGYAVVSGILLALAVVPASRARTGAAGAAVVP